MTVYEVNRSSDVSAGGQAELQKHVGLVSATALIVGTMIGNSFYALQSNIEIYH